MDLKKGQYKNEKRVRSWCFTLNNYTKDDIAQLTHEKFQYQTQKICFQEELGEESKVPHLQGVLQFKEKKTLKNVKAILPRAHWEVCKSLHASIKYCSKKLSRNGDVFKYGPIDKWVEKEKKSLRVMIEEWKIAEKADRWVEIRKSIQKARDISTAKYHAELVKKNDEGLLEEDLQ